MMKKWQQYFSLIQDGYKAWNAEQTLSKAYGNKANVFGVYPAITETRQSKIEELNSVVKQLGFLQREQGFAFKGMQGEDINSEVYQKNARSADRLGAQQIPLRIRQQELMDQIKAMTPANANDKLLSALERNWESLNKTFTDSLLNKAGSHSDEIRKSFDEEAKRIRKEDEGKPGIRSFKDFMERWMSNASTDVKTLLGATSGPLEKWWNTALKEFKPGDVTAGNALAGAGGDKGPSFAAALEYGTKEAYSAIFGNDSKQDRMLKANERTANASEDTAAAMEELLGGMTGLFNSQPSAGLA
jgi:hypothetical protein